MCPLKTPTLYECSSDLRQVGTGGLPAWWAASVTESKSHVEADRLGMASGFAEQCGGDLRAVTASLSLDSLTLTKTEPGRPGTAGVRVTDNVGELWPDA